MSATAYMDLAILNLIFGQSAISAIGTLYFGLSTTDPTSSGSYSGEPTSTGSYARVAVTNNGTNWPSANPKLNANAITFPASTAAWSSGATALAYWFVSDASTLGAGNMLFSGALTTSRTVNAAGVTLQFAASAISVTAT